MLAHPASLAGPLLDPARLAAVSATKLLDTAPEPAFDRMTTLARKLLDVPFAFVTVVDGHRSFWKSCIGVDATDLASRQNPVEESFCQYVIQLNEPLIVSDARVNDITHLNPSIARMGVVAWAGFPLRTLDGLVLGTFCAVDTKVHEWTPDEIEVLATLASAVEGEIRLRSQLDQAAAAAELAQRDSSVREHVANLAEAMVAADTTDAVAVGIIGAAPDILGAVAASLGLVDTTGRALVMTGAVANHEDLRARYESIALTDTTPIVDAATNGRPVFVRTPDEMAERYPDAVHAATTLGLAATASIPLHHSNGSLVGAITFGWSSPQRFDGNDRALLRTVGLMCAQSIERAQLGDVRRALINSLQNELLGHLPRVPGLATAVRHAAAHAGAGIGGDWYDIIDLDDGRAVVVIGDIAGHGFEAAARMTQLRGAINALARLYADDVANVIVEAERMLRHLKQGYIATVLVLVVDRSASTITYVSAGHAPAAVILPDGTATVLRAGLRPVLGNFGVRAEPAVVPFPVGAVLAAFTDGLVERRDQSIDAGTERLVSIIQAALGCDGDMSPEFIADCVITELIGAREISDDVALVVVRHEPAM